MYSIRFLPAAEQDLVQLDKTISRRAIDRLRWLAANVGSVRLHPLTGDVAGLYRLRTGDYRMLFELVHEKRLIVIHPVGHRRGVYKE